MNRRHFLGQAALAGAGSTALPSNQAHAASVATVVGDSRASWVAMLRRVAEPVLGHLAADRLKRTRRAALGGLISTLDRDLDALLGAQAKAL